MSNAAVTKCDALQNKTLTPESSWHRRLAAFASFAVGVLLGGLIWALSRRVTGFEEPWDATGFYYFFCLFGAGGVSTLVYARSWLYGTLGVYLGQVAYMTYNSTPGDPQVLPALLSVAIFGLLPAFTGSLASFFTCKLWRMNCRRTKR